MLLAIYVVASLGYVVIEGWPAGRALYMTAIVVSTVGFGEVYQLDTFGRVWTFFVILIGVGTVGLALSSLQALVVSGDVRRFMGQRRLESEISQLSGHIIICGYGRMGETVVSELKGMRARIVVIDKVPEVIRKADEEGLLYVLGNAEDEETLLSAGLKRAKALVSVLPSDADNVYVTLTARGYRRDMTIIARAEQQSTVHKLNRAGATRVVCPEVTGAARIAHILMKPHFVDFVESVAREMELELDEYTVQPGSPAAGKTLRQAAIRQRVGGMVVAIRRADGKMLFNPEPDQLIEAQDTLLMIGQSGMSSRLEAWAKSIAP